MLFRPKRRRLARKALRDVTLQKALERASLQHNQKHLQTSQDVPWEEYKQRARAIREKNIGRLPEIIDRFTREAEKAGAKVYRASGPEEAVEAIRRIAREKKARLIVKSKSMVSEEIGLNKALEEDGLQVVETDLGEWIIQLAGDRPSHITAPALHLTREKIAEILTRRLGRIVPTEAKEIVRIAREELRKKFFEADIGLSGANLAIAESGTLAVVSNEGNVRLATTLPPVHIALVTAEKFVETMEEAASLLKTLTIASAGKKLTSYVSFITGPSSTTDIEKEHVVGVHGPEEVHIIVLDGGRLALAESADFNEILYCLKCGGCMLVCPVFQSVGGHVFGGPVYPGGIGTLLTAMTRSLGESSATLDFCADCKKCEAFCPVGIPTGSLLLKLKDIQGPDLLEKGLSWLFKSAKLSEKGAGFLSLLQRVWQKDGTLRRLPLSWARGKRIPVLRPKPTLAEVAGDGPKVYLFQGCLAKYFFSEVRESVVKTLNHFGYRVVVPPEQVCCGAPSLHLGDRKSFAALAVRNLGSFEREDPETIITVCPTGHAVLKDHYPALDRRAARFASRVQDFTSFLASKGHRPQPAAPGRPTMYYHYPCHSLNGPKNGETPPRLLRDLGFDLTAQREPSQCCGFCGVFSVKNPEIAARLLDKKREDIHRSGAGLVATDCPGCLFQLRAGLEPGAKSVRAYHTAEIIAGLLDPDPPSEKT